MNDESRKTLRMRYADVLSGNDDPTMLKLVEHLDSRYRPAEPPAALKARIARMAWSRRSENTRIRRLRWSRLAVPLVLASVLILATGGVLALQNVINLGKPTSNLPSAPNSALGGFRHTGPFLRQGGKPELLFLGTMVDDYSSIERWPLVKAMEQFGTFSGVTGTQMIQCFYEGSGYIAPGSVHCNPPDMYKGYFDGAATYNLEGARYHSRYLSFDDHDLIDAKLHLFQGLSAADLALYRRYLRNTYHYEDGAIKGEDGILWNTAIGTVEGDPRAFPLLSVGGYLQTAVHVAIPGDLTASNSLLLPFNTVQQTLAAGKATGPVPILIQGTVKTPGTVPVSLVTDVNAEANVITALICHADGKRPGSVCNRPVIEKLLRHVK